MRKGEASVIGADDLLKDPIPLNTWLYHRHSENVFRVLKVNAWSLETEDLDGTRGGANRWIIAQDIRRHTIIVDKKGSSQS